MPLNLSKHAGWAREGKRAFRGDAGGKREVEIPTYKFEQRTIFAIILKIQYWTILTE